MSSHPPTMLSVPPPKGKGGTDGKARQHGGGGSRGWAGPRGRSGQFGGMMDIRSRAESLRPFRYFRSHRQHEREFEFAGTGSQPEAPDSYLESQDARQMGPNAAFLKDPVTDGSEERRVGKECRSRW